MLGAMQTLFTVRAAAEAALVPLFVAMAHDPDMFMKANPNLERKVDELSMENVESKEIV